MAPLRPEGVNLTHAQRKKWTDLAKLEYLVARVPSTEILTQMGIEECFRELCQQGQLTRLFLEAGPPSYHRLTLEFLSTFEINSTRDRVLGLKFQLRNQRYEWTIAEFNEAFGFTGEIHKIPWAFKSSVNEFWGKITATKERFSASSSKATMIRNPVLRMLHKTCACYPFARKEQSSVHREELFILWTILHQAPPLNMGHFMIKHLDRASKKTKGYICVGKVISFIAHHLGVNTGGLVADFGGEPMDYSFLHRADMIDTLQGRSFRLPSQLVFLQKDKKDFPLPNTALTYVNGPEQQANWGMNTQAHRALAIRRRGNEDPAPDSSDEEDEESEEDEDEEEEEETEEQPESSRRTKRSRPPASTSSDDHMRTLLEGMTHMQLNQAQLASTLEQLPLWRQADLDWQAGVTAQLAAQNAQLTAQGVQLNAQAAQLHQLQMQQDATRTELHAWRAEDTSRWGEEQAFYHAYYARFPPPAE